jgi:aldose 1-epimerase
MMKGLLGLLMVAGSTALAVEAPKPVPFGVTADGTPVEIYTLTNAHGLRLRAMTYGGTVVGLEVPDREGKLADVVLGYDSLAEYVKRSPYFGAVVGRYGNRIAKGKFRVDGKEYTLALNNSPGGHKCALHGGIRGFDKVVWKGEGLVQDGAQGVRFTYLSTDGEEGYPGNLSVSVTYLLTDANEWQVIYEMRTDKTTPVNVTQHSYFNLEGEGSDDILSHELKIVASKYTPVDAGLIPTGELAPVSGTPFDFTSFQPIGARVNERHEQLTFAKGYDHNWVLDSQSGDLALAASVHEPGSGRTMDVFTTEPGVQFYSGNFLDGSLTGKSGNAYKLRDGFCLETQHFPDSPNNDGFPSTLLEPGQAKLSKTVFRFTAR